MQREKNCCSVYDELKDTELQFPKLIQNYTIFSAEDLTTPLETILLDCTCYNYRGWLSVAGLWHLKMGNVPKGHNSIMCLQWLLNQVGACSAANSCLPHEAWTVFSLLPGPSAGDVVWPVGSVWDFEWGSWSHQTYWKFECLTLQETQDPVAGAGEHELVFSVSLLSFLHLSHLQNLLLRALWLATYINTTHPPD